MATYLYHEKQDSALCAVHSLNNLLQGPFFSPVELMDIALELDRKEKALMAELGNDTKDFLKYMSEDSGNVAADGNFSIEVIKKALEVFNLTTVTLNHPDMADAAQNPQNEKGFVCHIPGHWFAIRSIEGTFWDLNSLHKQPAPLSELYLGVFLKQLQVEKYTIYVVRGAFPEIYRDTDSPNWVLASANQKKPVQEKYYSLKDDDDDELARAIAASLGMGDWRQTDWVARDAYSMFDCDATVSLSGNATPDRGGGKTKNPYGQQGAGDDDDLARAIALSVTTAEQERETKRRKRTLVDEPGPSETQIANIMIRLANGKKVGRKFSQSNVLEDVWNWLYLQHEVDISENSKFVLFSSLDRSKLLRKDAPLGELGLKGNVLLNLEEK